MARQRCTIDAIIDAADPVTLLRKYQDLAATTKDIVSTDIPRSALDDFVDLAFLVKDAETRSVVFDSTLIDPAYPDYDQMRQVVEEALAPPSTAPGLRRPGEHRADRADQHGRGGPPPATEDPAADVADACAYDEAQARGGPGRRASPRPGTADRSRGGEVAPPERAEADGQQPDGDGDAARRPAAAVHDSIGTRGVQESGDRSSHPARPVQRLGQHA